MTEYPNEQISKVKGNAVLADLRRASDLETAAQSSISAALHTLQQGLEPLPDRKDWYRISKDATAAVKDDLEQAQRQMARSFAAQDDQARELIAGVLDSIKKHAKTDWSDDERW